MNSIIICEGKTDAILTSYYLDKVHNWSYIKKTKDIPIKIEVEDKESEVVSWYNQESKKLCIWGIGGVSNFPKSIKKIIDINKVGNEDQTFENIVIITDRDDETNNINIINQYSNIFKDENINTNLQIGQLNNTSYKDEFDEEQEMSIGLIVVPIEGKGAIETFLLDSLSENESEKYIVEKSKEFVHSIEGQVYLRKRRDKVKAELGVTFALISPDKVFTRIDELLRSIDWIKYTTIQEGFKILQNI